MLQNKHKHIIEKHGEDVIKKLWYTLGYRRAADRLSISVGVLRTIVRNKKWKKPAKYLPNVMKAIKSGSACTKDYPHVCFDEIDKHEFISSKPFLYNEDIEITLIPDESENSNIFDKSFLLQININKSNPIED